MYGTIREEDGVKHIFQQCKNFALTSWPSRQLGRVAGAGRSERRGRELSERIAAIEAQAAWQERWGRAEQEAETCAEWLTRLGERDHPPQPSMKKQPWRREESVPRLNLACDYKCLHFGCSVHLHSMHLVSGPLAHY